jgi:glutamate-5-semialdehyde dehydrogenase
MVDIESYMAGVGRKARAAARVMAQASTASKDAALLAMADAIEQSSKQLITANGKDLAAGAEHGLNDALLDRLTLNESLITAMADGLRQIAGLRDPVGEISNLTYRPSGIQDACTSWCYRYHL